MVNSNFGILNHTQPRKRLIPSQIPEAKRADYAQMSPPLDYWRFREKMLDQFRHMLPQLARLPLSHIHKPWQAPANMLRDAGVRLGETYPFPIVDHHQARERAL
ncbi:MAG: FAD-binding domain-containing protein, partial [Hyphomicrobiales bacterium]